MPSEDFGVRLQSLLLADYANVRDGLLTVVGAGITRVGFANYPAQLPLWLAVQLYVPPTAFGVMNSGQVSLRYADAGENIATASLMLQTSPVPGQVRHSGEPLYVNVALPLPIPIPRPGEIDINFEVNKTALGSVTFFAVEGPPPEG